MLALRQMLNRLGQRIVMATAEPVGPQPIVGEMLCRRSEKYGDEGLCHIAHPVAGGWNLHQVSYRTDYVGALGNSTLVWNEEKSQFLAHYGTPHQAVKTIRDLELSIVGAPETEKGKWTYNNIADAPPSNLDHTSRRLGVIIPLATNTP